MVNHDVYIRANNKVDIRTKMLKKKKKMCIFHVSFNSFVDIIPLGRKLEKQWHHVVCIAVFYLVQLCSIVVLNE